MTTIAAGTTQNTGYVATVDSSGNLVFQTNGTTTALTLDTAQNANIVGRVTAAGANISANALTVGNSFYIVANGNVGVGNSTPNSTFVVRGSTTGALPVVSIQASGNGTFMRGVQLLNGGMGNGAGIMYGVGYEDSSRNMGQMTYHYTSSNSSNNRVSLSLHSVDDVINVWGSNIVSISNTTPSTNYKLTVQGNTYISGTLYSTLASHQDHEYVRSFDGQLASVDLNNLYTLRSGLYYSGNSFSTNSNLPASKYFTLLNLRNPGLGNVNSAGDNSDRTTQLWFGDTVGTAYIRNRQGSSGWWEWENILTTGVPGTIVQVAYNTNNNGSGTITGSTMTSTGISVSITPKSANNLIMILGHLHVYKSSTTPHFVASIYRGGTAIVGGSGVGGSDNDGGQAHYDAPIVVVDAPNTTSSTTYTWYAATREAGTIQIKDGGSYRSGIVAIEITGVHPGRG